MSVDNDLYQVCWTEFFDEEDYQGTNPSISVSEVFASEALAEKYVMTQILRCMAYIPDTERAVLKSSVR